MYQSLLGGALIGLSASLLLLFDGRIAGISGIAGGFLSRWSRDSLWRILFVVGLVCGPAVFRLISGNWPEITVTTSTFLLAPAGLLVGIGTQLGSGCTSGHGVCGLGRLSLRSFAAVSAFMLAAAVTVALIRHATV